MGPLTVISQNEHELEDTVEILNQKLSALVGSSQELGVIMSLHKGMTHRLAMILMILVNRAPAVISRSTFHTLFYAHMPNGGPEPKIFAVHIYRLRGVLRRLEAPGKIDTVWNAGYRANPSLVKWVHRLYSSQIRSEK